MPVEYPSIKYRNPEMGIIYRYVDKYIYTDGDVVIISSTLRELFEEIYRGYGKFLKMYPDRNGNIRVKYLVYLEADTIEKEDVWIRYS